MEEYQRLYRLSLDNPEWFWAEHAKALPWFHPWHKVLDADYEEIDFAWFSGGRLNACFNCVDRHLDALGEKTAILWAADEPGTYRHISYRELKHNVCRIANVLIAHGVQRGDRVCIYMPMIPETVYAMLACARIGAIHSVVFGGFSADSLRDRIVDARCKVLFTANEGLRGRRRLDHRPQLHRLRPAGQRRHHRHVREHAGLSGPGSLLAHGGRPRHPHLLHRAHRATRHRPGGRRAREALLAQVAAHPRH